ncbi:MAG TPA: ATP-binding protein [Gemmatimonadales bacterium]|nr:ATP-binding protein [Gemmatimonadales bacterium]
MPSRDPALDLLASVGRLLNAGLGFEATLAAVADAVRTGLPAGRVRIWLREPGGVLWRAVSAPAGPAPAPVPSLDAVPPLEAGAVRLPLVQDGDRLGVLEAAVDRRARDAGLLEVLADFLTPYLASAELSADLAHEVATQSREIDEQRRFISLIIDSLPVGLYVVDREYRIQIWNRKRETGTQGVRRADVMGRPVFEVLTRQPAGKIRAEFDRVFETGTILQEEIEVATAGETRWFRITKIPMRLEGDAITHVITVGEDVTEAKLTQHRVLQSEKLAAIGHLAAGVMHEINNPLATISACVAAIEGRLDEPEPAAAATVREYLQIVDKEVERCTGIVNGLLDFSRPKGRAKQAVALNTVVEDALFLLKHHRRFKQLAVTRELDPALPAVTGNAEQLIQALMALMLNAVDAMEAGGRLTLRTGRVRTGPDEVSLEVEDTGPGIPRAEQSKIFEPFYTTKPQGKGTGLGLSICYGIVQEHGGRIEVESQPGQGSRFRVVLPVGEGARSQQ